MSNVRNKRQAEAKSAFYLSSFNRATLALCTGFGKSKVALDIRREIQPQNTIISTPTVDLQQNWKQEFNKWGISLDNVDFCCHVSNHKLEKEYDFGIFDEIHCITEQNQQFPARMTVGLTGTPPKEEKLELLNNFAPIIHKYTLQQGVEDKIIAPYNIIPVGVFFNQKDKEYLIKKTGRKVTEQAYSRIVDINVKRQYAYYRKKGQEAPVFVALQRMNFLAQTKSKLKAVNALREITKPEKRVIFCRFQKQADLFPHSFHGNTGNTLKEFKEGKFSELAVVNKLDMGENVPYLDEGHILSIDSSRNRFWQRLGRLVRDDFPEKIGDMYVYLHIGSQEEKWYKNAIGEEVSYKYMFKDGMLYQT